MTATTASLAQRAVELRSAFDRAFAKPLRDDVVIKHDLLAFRVGVEPYAFRLAEVAGIFVDRRITRVPGGNAALLGIAGFRGALVPVYSLGVLLGQSGADAPRWLVIAATAPVAIAFDAFESHLRVAIGSILPRQAHSAHNHLAPAFIRTAEIVRPILHLPSVIDALGAAERPGIASEKE